MPARPWAQQDAQPPATLRLHHRALPGALAAAGGSEALFWGLFGGGDAADTFWLDSATATDRGRFSFMGGRGGSLWRRIEFRLAPPPPAAENGHNGAASCTSPRALPPGTLTITAGDGSQQRLSTDFFGWLQGLLESHRCRVRCAVGGSRLNSTPGHTNMQQAHLNRCMVCCLHSTDPSPCAAAPLPAPAAPRTRSRCPSTSGAG